jgi:hypothetical protein
VSRPGVNQLIGGSTVWQDLVRLGIGWGGAAALVGFWYYVMRGIGTF